MRHRLTAIIGCVAGTAALLLLTAVTHHAILNHQPLTNRCAVGLTAAVLLGGVSIRLLGDALARDQGHIDGVRETVDRLVAALRNRPTS